MEYCGGGSLLEIVEIYDQFRLNERQVAYITREVRTTSFLHCHLALLLTSWNHFFSLLFLCPRWTQCVKALFYVHSMGRLHRDIKSNNILLSSKGQVKISTILSALLMLLRQKTNMIGTRGGPNSADFGFAAQLTEEKQQRNTILGTAYWMVRETALPSPQQAAASSF